MRATTPTEDSNRRAVARKVQTPFGLFDPFSQRGGLGKAHQLFGEQLAKLLDELNEALAA